MAVPNQALQRFEEHKDNPMVQALINFITSRLERPLLQVDSWGIEVSDKPARKFYLRFTDGERIEGRLDEIWQVRVFSRTSESVSPPPSLTSADGRFLNELSSEKVLPISEFTGEPYDPAWGYKQRRG